jgi:predicted ATPase
MRGYGQMKRPQLAPDGSNFSGALAHLCESSEEKQAIVDWLTELLAPEIADIDFVGVKELGDVMAILVEKDGKRVPARGLSDGTLRFLGLLLALRTAEPGSLFLIEDIDSGLHPARVHVLVEFLEALVRERDVQVIATTHAPVVLQALSRETLLSAVVFGRVPGHEGTLMRRLGDLPHFEEALARKGIDELFATGWLEMAL